VAVRADSDQLLFALEGRLDVWLRDAAGRAELLPHPGGALRVRRDGNVVVDVPGKRGLDIVAGEAHRSHSRRCRASGRN